MTPVCCEYLWPLKTCRIIARKSSSPERLLATEQMSGAKRGVSKMVVWLSAEEGDWAT
jgi:hypothetical protein